MKQTEREACLTENTANANVRSGGAERDEHTAARLKHTYAVNLFHKILFQITSAGGEDIMDMVDGYNDDDYLYKVERLSPDYCFERDGYAMFDHEGLAGFFMAVGQIQWLTRHEGLLADDNPFLWSAENISALRAALEALLDVQKTVIDADLWWQTQDAVENGITFSYGMSVDEWADRCSQGEGMNTGRLRHVWGNCRQKTPNYVLLASTLPADLPELVMLQGLLAYTAGRGNVPRRVLVNRLRSLRNMVANTPREDFPSRLKAMLAEARELMNEGRVNECSDTFCHRQKCEEARKLRWLGAMEGEENEDREAALCLFENHPLLRGAVDFISLEYLDMNHYYAFCELFNDMDADYGELLRNALIYSGMKMERGTPDGAYWHRFLTTDSDEWQAAKRKAIAKVLAAPVRQFELVKEDWLGDVGQKFDDTMYLKLKSAYYNCFPDGREDYLRSLIHHGI